MVTIPGLYPGSDLGTCHIQDKLAAGDKELEAFGMATRGQVSGILRTESCSTCCLWAFLPHAVFDSVLTWHSMDTQAHTTKGVTLEVRVSAWVAHQSHVGSPGNSN